MQSKVNNMENTVFAIFAEPIGACKLNRDLTQNELDYIYGLEQDKNTGNLRSKRWDVLDSAELKDLKSFLQSSVTDYFNGIYKPKTDSDVSVYITQSWTNYNEKGMSHHQHSHSGSFISGVFYVNANPKCDKILFCNPINNYQPFPIQSSDRTPFNTAVADFEVETNLLLLFRSHVQHSVPPVDSAIFNYKTRVSLSFNTFIKGTLGSLESFTRIVI